MATTPNLSERLLKAAIEKQVQEKLGSLGREMHEFAKDMTPEETKAAKLMILEMVNDACVNYYLKMKERIQSQKG